MNYKLQSTWLMDGPTVVGRWDKLTGYHYKHHVQEFLP